MKNTSRLVVGVLAALNALAFVAALDLLYTFFPHRETRVLPPWFVVSFGVMIGWRATVYVRDLVSGSATHYRPAIEALGLVGVITLVWAMNTEAIPSEGGLYLRLVIAGMGGCVGAIVSLALIGIDVACVTLLQGRTI